jgi:hypothetical protein
VLAGAYFAWLEYREQQNQGYSFEWGGVIVLDDLEPIALDDLPVAIRKTVAP